MPDIVGVGGGAKEDELSRIMTKLDQGIKRAKSKKRAIDQDVPDGLGVVKERRFRLRITPAGHGVEEHQPNLFIVNVTNRKWKPRVM